MALCRLRIHFVSRMFQIPHLSAEKTGMSQIFGILWYIGQVSVWFIWLNNFIFVRTLCCACVPLKTSSKSPTKKAIISLVWERHWRPLRWTFPNMWCIGDTFLCKSLYLANFVYFLSLAGSWERKCFPALAAGHAAPYYETTDNGARQCCQREIVQIHGAQAQAGTRQVSSSLASPGADPLSDRWRRQVEEKKKPWCTKSPLEHTCLKRLLKPNFQDTYICC